MKRLTAVIVAAVSALLFAGGSASASSSVFRPIDPRVDTFVDYGQLVKVTGTPEVCGLSQAPTQVKIRNKTWTKLEMSPVIFCWTSKTGKPVVGAQVAMAYLVKGDVVVLLSNWKKRGGTKLVLNLVGRIWTTVKSPDASQVSVEMAFQDILLSPDQLAGKVRKRTRDIMGRFIVSRQTPELGCFVQPDPIALSCQLLVARDEWSPGFWINAPWRNENLDVFYTNPSCSCAGQVIYDPDGSAGG